MTGKEKVRIWYREDGFLKFEDIDWSRKFFPEFVSLDIDWYFVSGAKLDLNNLRILYFDIEVDDRDPSLDFSTKRVLSVVAIDDQNRVYEIVDDDEETILNKVYFLFRNYDLIIGFNSDHFDFPLLIERGKKYNINFEKLSYKFADFYTIAKKFNNINVILSSAQLRSWSLDSLGQHFLGISKVKLEQGIRDTRFGGTIYDLFVNDRDKLVEYNRRDVEILKGLCDYFDLIPTLKMMSEVSGCPVQYLVRSIGKAVEFLMYKKIWEEKRIDMFEVLEEATMELKTPYEGALVLIKKEGYYENIAIYDFSSMYPSIMRTFNLSLETVRKLSEEEYNSLLKLDESKLHLVRKLVEDSENGKVGFIPSILDELYEKRKKYKASGEKTKEVAVKLIMNSFYGYFGGEDSKFKSVRLASLTTAFARFLISRVFNRFGGIYGDTDSVFLPVREEDIDRMNEEINNYVRSLFEGIISKRFFMKMEFKLLFSSLILLDKKRYIGLVSLDEKKNRVNEIFSKGSELVRSDFTVFGKRLLDELVRKILVEKNLDIKSVFEFLRIKKESLFRGEVPPEDLALTSTLTKLPKDYKTVPVHVKAVMNSKRFNYFIGQKISYILIGLDEDGREAAMELQDFLESYSKGLVKPDYQLYWERKIFPSIFRILKTVFGEEEVRRHLPLLEARGYQSSVRDYLDKELRLVSRKIYKLI